MRSFDLLFKNTKDLGEYNEIKTMITQHLLNQCENTIWSEFLSESVLVHKSEEISLLKAWLLPKEVKGSRLLMRGSRDGFSPDFFDQACANNKNTLILLRSNHGMVFGGYACQKWPQASGNSQTNDPHAFLFSLTRRTKHPSHEGSRHHLRKSNQNWMFMFGRDLFIGSLCNRECKCSTNSLTRTFLPWATPSSSQKG